MLLEQNFECGWNGDACDLYRVVPGSDLGCDTNMADVLMVFVIPPRHMPK
jgi:hypothetical protein